MSSLIARVLLSSHPTCILNSAAKVSHTNTSWLELCARHHGTVASSKAVMAQSFFQLIPARGLSRRSARRGIRTSAQSKAKTKEVVKTKVKDGKGELTVGAKGETK